MEILDNKEKRFVEEYLIDLNVERSAIAAGYSQSMASSKAYQWVSDSKVKPRVFYAIHQQMQERSKRTEVTQDRVLLEIARLAFNDPRKAFDDYGNLLPIQEWPDEVAAAISAIKITELKTDDGSVSKLKEVKFWDKGKQIELAGKHLGMFTDNVNFKGNVAHKVVFETIVGNKNTTD